jgi:4-hydroxy-tetrahydrodipicolinate synthase
MITPLRARDTLDEEGVERLVGHLLGGGVSGLFVLGTNGEGPALGYRLRKALIERVCRRVGGRVPVLVGITDSVFEESLEIARAAADSGAQGLVLAPPFYFPLSQPEFLEYLERLVPELPLPLMLYNMPMHTKLMIAPETVRRAMDIPGIIGLKDSSADMTYFHEVIAVARQRPEFTVLIGPEALLADTVMMGGHGGVCGGANLFPELYVSLYRAAAAGDLALVRRLHEVVMRIGATLYRTGQYGSSLIKGYKCTLALEGICEGYLAEPFRRFKEPEVRKIREHLEVIKPMVRAALEEAARSAAAEPAL